MNLVSFIKIKKKKKKKIPNRVITDEVGILKEHIFKFGILVNKQLCRGICR